MQLLLQRLLYGQNLLLNALIFCQQFVRIAGAFVGVMRVFDVQIVVVGLNGVDVDTPGLFALIAPWGEGFLLPSPSVPIPTMMSSKKITHL